MSEFPIVILMHITQMNLQKMQNPDMDLVLSTDAKPRLKWTPALHHRFIEAITQLGGADRATPKNIMRVMCIPGLTLYHLKSHLQKYRLGKNQQSEICDENDGEGYTEVDYRENEIESGHVSGNIMGRTQVENDESSQITQALKMQMEVQENLCKQIEVQRHLQLRIEAQGKYLQSILTKAQDTLSGYTCFSMGLEATNTEVSELVSDTRSLGLTKTGDFFSNTVGKRSMRDADCSLDSSLTSSESSGRKDEEHRKQQTGDTTGSVLQLMDINSNGNNNSNTILNYQLAGRKRSGSTISDESSVEQPLTKYQNRTNSGKLKLDLNCPIDESLP